MIVAGAGELHLEIFLNDLKELSGVEFTKSDPAVSYKETILGASEQSVLGKSPNKHNRLWFKAEPLSDGMADAIDNGELDLKVFYFTSPHPSLLFTPPHLTLSRFL